MDLGEIVSSSLSPAEINITAGVWIPELPPEFPGVINYSLRNQKMRGVFFSQGLQRPPMFSLLSGNLSLNMGGVWLPECDFSSVTVMTG